MCRGAEMELEKELSYRQLCEEFNLEPAMNSGKKRKLQLENLQNLYNIEKTKKGKYIIHREYTEEEKALIQAEKNYNNFVQAALLDLIADGDIKQVYTYTDFRKKLYMVNKNYFLYKYGKEEIDIKVPYDFPNDLVEEFEGRWFNIVEEHDKYILKTNLLRLKEKGLIEYYESYMLRKIYHYGKNKIYEKAQMATEEQRAAIEQTKLEFMKSVNANSIQELYKLGPTAIKKYYHVISNKIHELGFDEYSKAFIIFRASELKRLVGFFAPKFNNAQVNRLLKSKRFGIIPKSIHEQMVEKAIKYEPEVFATAEELKMIKKEG